MDCFERKAAADKAKLCVNCLSGDHFVLTCSSIKNCQQCGQRHHTLLHFPINKNSSSSNSSNSSNSTNVQTAPQHHSNSSGATTTSSCALVNHIPSAEFRTQSTNANGVQILLATVIVKVIAADGRPVLLRALLDQGSQITLITERATQNLGLHKQTVNAEITGIGGENATRIKHFVALNVLSCIDTNFNISSDAFIMKHLTSMLPSSGIQPSIWPHIVGLQLADPHYFRSSNIDILFGADIYAQILLPGLRKGNVGEPIAQNTAFGWVLSGGISSEPSNKATLHCFHVSTDLDQLVRRFYELEDIPIEQQYTSEEQWCEEFYQQTHIRQPNGQYMVCLPLKHLFDPTQTLGKSRYVALNRLHQLERKLSKNPSLSQQYANGIEEYLQLDQIKLIKTSEEQHRMVNQFNAPTYTYSTLAHHAVVKMSISTTKVRIVFDASAKTSNGKSLNDLLCIGPPLQLDLAAVIMNWRLHRFVFTADIEKLYRRIDVNHSDAQYQRILWRKQNDEILDFCLTVVTFGTACAPYLAIRTIHQLADDESTQYPLASNVLKREMYVDDIYTGEDDIEATLKLRNQVSGALKSAGFELRKWASNSPAILESISSEHLANSSALELNSDELIKTLGVSWQPEADKFKFKLNFDIDVSISTKRSILSIIARLFDPLGFLNPVIVVGKIFLKQVWSHGLDWDEPLPSEFVNEWQRFIAELPKIDRLNIIRWLQYSPRQMKNFELHVFCDGSLHAYSAVVYIRIQTHTGEFHSNLLTAKTKVSPMKSITIPRIELSAAVLAAKLVQWVIKNIKLPTENIDIFFWTDATIVLSWIRGNINRWKPFVANRITKILSSSSVSQWHHISTHENPADCSSRGLTPSQLAKFDLWWHGPQWLSKSINHWPKTDWTFLDFDVDESEMKKQYIHIARITDTVSIIHRYSSLSYLRRIVGQILRFRHNCLIKDKQQRLSGPLTVEEWNLSLLTLVKVVQQECFSFEISLIRRQKSLPIRNKLIGLAPFIDQSGILRVRGRLQNAKLKFNEKHPIIMPSSHHFTNLLINDSHHNTLHGGAQVTLTYIRKNFWILNARNTIRHQIKKCITCFHHKPDTSTQLMGNLPTPRVTPSRPFAATGVDYAGPIELRASKFRGNTSYKGYIAVFICLSAKAIHLEAVTNMTTEYFLWALLRFIGRRGMCHDLYSDCGTNFIGANNILKKNINEFVASMEKNIIPKLTALGIQWHFLPPAASSMAGLWESNVKSVKHHLKRITDGTRLTYEELSTVLAQIESCLNSRPLAPLANDPTDLTVLTPGHFLIGDSLLSPPEPICDEFSPIRRYQNMQYMVQQFWKRWSSDWLSHLQSRPKWLRQEPNLRIDDLVLIKDERLPPNRWLLGRIVGLHPGADQLVRVVTVRTQHGQYKRSIGKICRLPIPNHSDASIPIKLNAELESSTNQNI